MKNGTALFGLFQGMFERRKQSVSPDGDGEAQAPVGVSGRSPTRHDGGLAIPPPGAYPLMPRAAAIDVPAATDEASCCPLCGRPNDCALVRGERDPPCWCVQASFAPSLLSRVPAALQGRACICARCVQEAAETAPPA